MKLISEQLQDVEFIKEEKENGKKDYKIKGIFMQADIKNRNGRVYPMDVLEKEVKRYNEEYVDKKRAFGELGHPEGPTVNLDKVSHMITKSNLVSLLMVFDNFSISDSIKFNL